MKIVMCWFCVFDVVLFFVISGCVFVCLIVVS